MFRIKSIDFEKIQNMLDAAESLDRAEETEKAESVLRDMAKFILGELPDEK